MNASWLCVGFLAAVERGRRQPEHGFGSRDRGGDVCGGEFVEACQVPRPCHVARSALQP